MNIRTARLIFSICAIVALIIQLRINGQSEKGKHRHYKLIDIGTFGEPQSYLNGFEYSTFSSVQDLSASGGRDDYHSGVAESICTVYAQNECVLGEA